MTALTWRDLLVETVREPQSAAQVVLDVQMKRGDIWMGVITVAALNAMFSTLLSTINPTPPEGLPILAVDPLPKAMIIGGLLVLLSHVLTWVGRMMGGQGQIDDLLKLMVWMQLVAIVLQAMNLLILLALPLIGSVLVLVIVFVMLRVMLAFIKVGHGMDSMGGAAVVLFASFVGMLVGLSALLVLIGAGNIGVQASV